MRRTRLAQLLLGAGLASLGSFALAQPGKTITVDGDATTEWTADDFVLAQNDTGDGFGPTLTLDELYVTWDNQYLYIGIPGDVSSLSGNLVTVFVDASAGGTGNAGWINTTSNINDTGEDRLESRISNMEFLFPEGIAFDLFAGLNDAARWESSGAFDNPFDDDFNGVRTFNGGNVGDLGYDCCGNEGHIVDATSGDFEWRVPWGRVFTEVGTYNTNGTLPAGASGSIGVFAVLSNNDGGNPFVSNQLLPNLLENGNPTGNNLGNSQATVSTTTTPFALSGVAVIDIDLNDDGILDIPDSQSPAVLGQPLDPISARFSLNSAAPGIVASGAFPFWDNQTIGVDFSEAPDPTTATDTANYTVSGLTVDSATFGTGSRAATVFLTVSGGAITDGTTVDVSGIQNVANTATIPATQFTIDALDLVDITLDRTGDQGEFLPSPAVRGGWDGFNTEFPFSDAGAAGDVYPEVPGTQAVDTTADDGIWTARVFDTDNAADTPFSISDFFDFTGFTTGSTNRRMGPGYFSRNFNYLTQGTSTESIDLVDPVDNRLLAEEVTVTFNVTVPVDEGIDLAQIDQDGTNPGLARVYITAGPTFGSEGAIPSDDLAGETDINGGLLLDFVPGSTGLGPHNFTGQATYAAGLPDVGTFRLGYTFDLNTDTTIDPSTEIFREEENSGAATANNLTNAEAVTAGTIPDPAQPAPYGSDANRYSSATVHPHIVRLASDTGTKALGRTINLTYGIPEWDVPAPPSDGVTPVEDWMLIEE